ncbi:MAG TPA: hypothetical protein VHZ77_10475 [Gaiellaceae bacterium]|nr:hypothetical protein [Gaiellaceae bacterium]
MDIQNYGLTIPLPNGWDGRIYRQTPLDAITLEATSARLAPIADDSFIQTEQGMGSADIYVRLSDIGPPPPYLGKGNDWQIVSSPPPIQPVDLQDFIEGHSLPAGVASAMVINNRAFMLYVGFGTWPSQAQLNQMNQILSQLQVEAEPVPAASS